MTVARGDVRSRVEFEGAGDSAAGLQRIESSLKAMGKAGQESANALQRIGAAFTPIRRNAEVINQIRGVFNMATQAVVSTGRAIADLAERTPRTKTELDRLRTSTNQLLSEFTRGLDTGRRFSGMFSDMSGGMAGAADAARTLGAGISGLISGLVEMNRVIGAAQTGGLTVLLQAGVDAAMSATRRVERSLGEGGPSGPRNFVYDPNAGANTETLARPGQGAGDHGAGSRRWGPAPRPRRSGGGGRGAGGPVDTTEFMADATERLMATQEAFRAQAEADAEFMADATEQLFEAEQELAQQRIDRAASVREYEQADHERRMGYIEELKEREAAEAEAQRDRDEARRDRIRKTFSDISGIASGLGTIFEQIADSEEERGKKADGWRKAVGVANGILSAIKAVEAAGAMGLAIAESNYLGAAAAAESIITYGLASGYYFSKLAGTGGGAGVSVPSSAGTFTPTQPQAAAPSETATDDRPIVVLGIGNTDAGVAAAMARANEQLLRSGRTPLRGSTGVGYQG